MKKYNITFTLVGEVPDLHKPEPSSKHVPEWYKNTISYADGKKIPDGNGIPKPTIKRCVPVFDAITSGYIIKTYCDIFISKKNGSPYFEWSMGDAINFHPIDQAMNHPLKNGLDYPKIMNIWGIKTDPGVSCLFTSPFHRDSPFNILPGIVDTDTYTAPINFPFVLKDTNFEGIIPAGTPVVQILPFPRGSWQMKIGNTVDFNEQLVVSKNLFSKFFDRYKSLYWHKKEYR